MKRIVCILLALLLIFGMSACGNEAAETEPAATEQTAPVTQPPETEPAVTEPAVTEPAVTEPAVTEPAVTEPAETEPAVTEPVETVPEHSDLYLEGVAVEDVILWFNEVVLDAEFSTGSGNASLVQKWGVPIRYQVSGDPTPEDLAVMEGFVSWLNTIAGFPGMAQAGAEETANLRIYFTDSQGMLDIMGQTYTGMDGAVTFWYDGMNQIYDANICILTGLDQYLRNSVILEEIYNGLGPVQDTMLRSDSLIYQEYSMPQALTEVDELILKLLYHPDIQCGMDAAQCEAVIRELYY